MLVKAFWVVHIDQLPPALVKYLTSWSFTVVGNCKFLWDPFADSSRFCFVVHLFMILSK